MSRPRPVSVVVSAAVVLGSAALSGSVVAADPGALDRIDHVVVIYQENHSFDNLYGGWEGVNGRSAADAAHTIQVGQAGAPYACLMQNDVNLASPPQPADCTDTSTATPFTSHFGNAPFQIDASLPTSATTCPPPGAFKANGFLNGTGLPGGCTRDIVHRFYQEQFQLDGGNQDRYTTGSDAVGLTQGFYDTRALPIYAYLHGQDHPKYAIADDFFQAAFGGSFLNHQWLIAAATPTFPGATTGQHSILDANGMPTSYPLYHATGPVKDTALTQACPSALPGRACGDFAVNTIQPPFQPTSAAANPNVLRLSPQTGTTIGDELSAAEISWGWYAGGWSNADGDVGAAGWTNGAGPACADPNSAPNPAFPFCPNKVFQYHHQPFNYYAAYRPGMPGRTHLRDEQEFLGLAQASSRECRLNAVSFVKPIGLENEHPGYTSETSGSNHLVSLIQSIETSACRKSTMIVVTYDEFGGQWDHVTPPGQGGAAGPADQWGPGTRIPALVISPFLHGDFVVDHAQHDTTSIVATIEHRFGLAPLGSRDAAIQDLASVFTAKAFDGGDLQE